MKGIGSPFSLVAPNHNNLVQERDGPTSSNESEKRTLSPNEAQHVCLPRNASDGASKVSNTLRSSALPPLAFVPIGAAGTSQQCKVDMLSYQGQIKYIHECTNRTLSKFFDVTFVLAASSDWAFIQRTACFLWAFFSRDSCSSCSWNLPEANTCRSKTGSMGFVRASATWRAVGIHRKLQCSWQRSRIN